MSLFFLLGYKRKEKQVYEIKACFNVCYLISRILNIHVPNAAADGAENTLIKHYAGNDSPRNALILHANGFSL